MIIFHVDYKEEHPC